MNLLEHALDVAPRIELAPDGAEHFNWGSILLFNGQKQRAHRVLMLSTPVDPPLLPARFQRRVAEGKVRFHLLANFEHFHEEPVGKRPLVAWRKRGPRAGEQNAEECRPALFRIFKSGPGAVERRDLVLVVASVNTSGVGVQYR